MWVCFEVLRDHLNGCVVDEELVPEHPLHAITEEHGDLNVDLYG